MILAQVPDRADWPSPPFAVDTKATSGIRACRYVYRAGNQSMKVLRLVPVLDISVRGVLRTIVATFLLTAMMELVLIVLSVLVTP